MSHLLRRGCAAAAVSALLVTGLSACGDKGASPFAGGATSAPATDAPTAATSSAAPATSATGDAGQASGSDVSKDEMASIIKDAMGKIDTAHEKLTMDMDVSGRSMQMQAEADLRMQPMAMSMTMKMEGQSVHALVVDGAMYMKMPGMPGGKWVKMDLKQLGAMLGGGAMTDAMTNPLGLVEQMSSYITSSTYVGEESVGGATAKHYRMSVDLKAAMKAMAPNLPKGTAVPSTSDQDLWIDDQGRVVKAVTDFGSGKVTAELSDFGKTVDVTAPPAGQVQTLPNVGGMGGMGGLSGMGG
jgi:hypothetical protein